MRTAKARLAPCKTRRTPLLAANRRTAIILDLLSRLLELVLACSSLVFNGRRLLDPTDGAGLFY